MYLIEESNENNNLNDLTDSSNCPSALLICCLYNINNYHISDHHEIKLFLLLFYYSRIKYYEFNKDVYCLLMNFF